MIRSSCLAGPLVCRWYAVVVKGLTPKYPQTNVENLLINCGSPSVRRKVGTPNGRSSEREKCLPSA